MKNFGKLGGALLLVTLLAALSAPAMADSMQFNSFSSGPWTENGMTVVSLVDHIHMDDGSTLYNHGENGCCSSPYLFTYSGGAFSLTSVDVNYSYLNGGSGYFQSSTGAIVFLTPGTMNFSGSDWTGITSFTWHDGSGDIDNLNFNAGGTATPEPGSLFLLGTGLLGMGGAVRRKFKV